MFNDFCFLEEVTDFCKLGTGHKRRKVVVVDQSRRILFTARVLHNFRLTWRRIIFDNGKSFGVKSGAVENQRVSLFLWTEELERRWQWQCEIEKAIRWMEGARPEDVLAFADVVAEESGMPKSGYDPFLVDFAKLEIEKRLRELGFVQLQRLTAMLYPASEQIAA
jgi:hypothetical protein